MCTLGAKRTGSVPVVLSYSPVEEEVIQIKYSSHDRLTICRVQERKEFILRVRRIKNSCPEMVTFEKGVEE